MNPMVLYGTLACGISKHTFFWSGSLKKTMFLTFDHFSHSMWSSNSVHEHEKGGHMNPMVIYCTFHTLCGHQIVVMGTKKVVT